MKKPITYTLMYYVRYVLGSVCYFPGVNYTKSENVLERKILQP